MYRTISKINQKSETYRKRLVFGIATSVTLGIAGIWAITIPARMERDVVANFSIFPSSDEARDRRGSLNIDKVTDQENDKSSDSPFKVLGRSISNSIDYARTRGSASATLSEKKNIIAEEFGIKSDSVKLPNTSDLANLSAESTVDLDFLPTNSSKSLDFLP